MTFCKTFFVSLSDRLSRMWKAIYSFAEDEGLDYSESEVRLILNVYL